uniref:Uncharacterized protein n=1 Tax=Rhizophora mucronata TaxID=61149 RepID=A0A2P2N4T1_RHIMU
MKKGSEHEDVQQELEILKAVAQAWHSHSGSCRPTSEYDARPQNFQSKPSRFKLEAMNQSITCRVGNANWDFKQSLWDSYEIVTVFKKLERQLVLDDPSSVLCDQNRVRRRHNESKNSLRNLFKRVSSKRFNEANVPCEEDTQF